MSLRLAVATAVLAVTVACTSTETAETTETLERTLTVREIDRDARSFDVTGDGQRFKLKVSDAVKNFDQIEVGDKLNVAYTRSVAVGMAVPGDTGETFDLAAGAVAEEGAKPAAAAGEIISTVVEFVEYDPETNIAILRENNGNLLATEVQREMRAFARARMPGDRIEVEIIEAFAIAIEPAA